MAKTNKINEKNIEALIAKAIKASDNSYLFENYSKQAQNVICALKKEGYIIIDMNPTPKMIRAGINAINLGLVDAKELVYKMFIDMCSAEKP